MLAVTPQLHLVNISARRLRTSLSKTNYSLHRFPVNASTNVKATGAKSISSSKRQEPNVKKVNAKG